METIIKQTRAVGTSAGVLLPRSWLNKRVVVTLEEKSLEVISRDVLDILVKENLLSKVKGIYLIGSYARGDQDSGSDIDILVISHDENKTIQNLEYEITIISEKNFLKNVHKNLYNLVAIREAKCILNSEMLKKFRGLSPKLEIKKIKKEIRSVIKINEGMLGDLRVYDATLYSLVLRLREIYLIKKLIKKQNYKKDEFLKIVGKDVYDAYLRVKRDKKELNSVSLKEGLKTLELLKKWLKELKE